MNILHFISVVSVLAAIASFVAVAVDLRNRPQSMKIMNIVWLLTMLWAGLLGLWAYFVFGRAKARMATAAHTMDMHDSMPMSSMPSMKIPKMDMAISDKRPHWQSIALSTLHCGAGCALADLTGEWITAAIPISIAGSVIAGSWVLDYLLALIFGVMFQYFAIIAMRTVSTGEAIKRAVKADFLSLTAWQMGMYGWMALVYFVFFAAAPLVKDSWMFWFMMQIAMVFGFLFAYPINALLVRAGIKQSM